MYDIKGLEAKWRRYRRRKMMPYVMSGILAVAMIIGFGWYYQTKQFDTKIEAKSHEDIAKKKATPTPLPVQSIFVRNDTIDALQKRKASYATRVDSPLSDSLMATASADLKQKSKRKMIIEVVDTKSRKKLKTIEKRFKLAHDPSDSLFLAKRYLAMKKFKKAEYWALQTNRLDEEIEDSWLIFAVAKAKQGKREEALKVLKAYIEKTGSLRAKELYGSIRYKKSLPLKW